MKIVTSLCTKCDRCVESCADNAITKDLETGFPVMTRGDYCNDCGHCISICPEDAISNEQPRQDLIPSSSITAPDIAVFLKAKRSKRVFSDKAVEGSVIQSLIETARYAPSGNNGQKRGYIVVTNKQIMSDLEAALLKKFKTLALFMPRWVVGIIRIFSRPLGASLDAVRKDLDHLLEKGKKRPGGIFRNAPCAIFIHGPGDDLMQDRDSCAIAQQYLMLHAEALGLGSCIIGYAQAEPKTCAKFVPVPKGNKIYSVLIVGYPKIPYRRFVYRKPARIEWME